MAKGKEEITAWRTFWENRVVHVDDLYEMVRCNKRIPNVEVASQSSWSSLADPGLITTLDVGCGVGDSILVWHTQARRVVGVDFSHKMLTRCRQRLKEEGLRNVQLVVADATALPFRDSCFDRSTNISVLQYMNRENCIKALSEFCRVAAADAYTVIMVKNSLSPYSITRWIALRVAKLIGLKKKLYMHYQPYYWYRKRMQELGSTIISEHSFGLEPILFPPFLVRAIRRVEEIVARKISVLRPFGVNYYLEALVRK